MRSVKQERTVAAPRSSVWAVLADYPNISDWNEAMANSYALGDAVEGVGASRRCEFGSKGSIKMRETVTEWAPEHKMVIAVDQTEKQPLKQGTMTITLSDGGETTPYTMSYDYEAKGGLLTFIYGPLLDRVYKKGFNGFIDDLERAAQARATA